MRSLTTTATTVLLLALAASGCKTGVIQVRGMSDGGVAPPDDAGPEGPMAAEMFASRVEPMLTTRCGACHGADRSGPDFLRPNPDVRTTLLSYPAIVDLRSPTSSRLLTKGEHAGPSLGAAEAMLVSEWIALEAREGTMVMPTERELSTMPTAIEEGFTMLSLERLGLPSTAIHFVAERVGRGIFLDSVQLAAGPRGARITHPVFVVWVDGVPTPDPVDRFSMLDLRVDANRTASFDTGTVVLTDFPEGAQLSVHFTVVEPTDGSAMPGADGGMPMPMPLDGCSQLDAFASSAAPALGSYCTRCHGGGNASATAAVDMTRVGASDPAMRLMGCNQILGRIDPMAPSASGIFAQPDPAIGGGHPFKFGTSGELNSFRSAILSWFEMEAP